MMVDTVRDHVRRGFPSLPDTGAAGVQQRRPNDVQAHSQEMEQARMARWRECHMRDQNLTQDAGIRVRVQREIVAALTLPRLWPALGWERRTTEHLESTSRTRHQMAERRGPLAGPL